MKSYSKILVTGGAGFIGTNLIKRLIDDGHEVESLDNYDSGLSENHQENCLYYSGDINTFLDNNLTISQRVENSWISDGVQRS